MEEAENHSEIATQLGENLVAAILQNTRTEDIKSLVETGAPTWYQTEAEGTSPLHAAAYVRNPELVQYLIEQGAVWNAGALTLSNTATSPETTDYDSQWTTCKTRPEILLSPITIPKSTISFGMRASAQVC